MNEASLERQQRVGGCLKNRGTGILPVNHNMCGHGEHSWARCPSHEWARCPRSPCFFKKLRGGFVTLSESKNLRPFAGAQGDRGDFAD